MSVAWKENVPVAGLAIGCFINGFFTTNAIVDYSVDSWALAQPGRLGFASSFYKWRSEAPVISVMMVVLLVPLPFILFDVAKGAAQSVFGWRRATTLRHAGDVMQCCLFACLLPYVITTVIPAQDALVAMDSACGAGARPREAAACEAAVNQLLTPHIVLVVLNVLLLCCDIAKYNGNTAAAAKKRD